VSIAKKAVDSTFRKILNYTAEIIMAIVLLIIICVPLIFAIPMWFQHVLFDVPRPDLSINPVEWFGLDGATWVTLFFGLASFSIAYFYVIKMNPGTVSEDVEEEAHLEDTEEESKEEGFETPLEDIEEEENIPLEDQELDEPMDDEISREDQEEESDLNEADDSHSDDE